MVFHIKIEKNIKKNTNNINLKLKVIHLIKHFMFSYMGKHIINSLVVQQQSS